MRKDLDAKVRLLIKSEKALLNLEIRKKSRQAVWVAMAILAMLMGLIILNFSAYLYLSTHYSDLAAALILSGLNFLVGLLFVFIALRQTRGPEAKPIEEIRDYAWEQISADVDELKQSVTDFKESVKNVKESVSSLRNADALSLKKIIPIINTLITLIDLNKRR